MTALLSGDRCSLSGEGDLAELDTAVAGNSSAPRYTCPSARGTRANDLRTAVIAGAPTRDKVTHVFAGLPRVDERPVERGRPSVVGIPVRGFVLHPVPPRLELQRRAVGA